jgi:hypothetical protein
MRTGSAGMAGCGAFNLIKIIYKYLLETADANQGKI